MLVEVCVIYFRFYQTVLTMVCELALIHVSFILLAELMIFLLVPAPSVAAARI